MKPVVYVVSRASVPERPARWRKLRQQGWDINSSWIDEAGPGETADFQEFWTRVQKEISQADGVILYATKDDFPLKGALVEIGMALAMGKEVYLVIPGVTLEARSFRPLGSWINHPNCFIASQLDLAYKALSKDG